MTPAQVRPDLHGGNVKRREKAKEVKDEEQLALNDEAITAFLIMHSDYISATVILDALLEHKIGYVISRLDRVGLGGDDEPPAIYARISKHVGQDVVSSIESHWSAERCLALKSVLHMSCAKYQGFLNVLSKDFDKDEELWCDLEVIPGVPFPKLTSKRQVLALSREWLKELGLEDAELVEGDAATVDIPSLLRRVLERECDGKGMFVGIDGGAQVMLDLAVEGDAAGVHRGISATRIVLRWRVAVSGVFPNTPFRTHTFVLVEGPDKYTNIKEVLKVPFEKIREVSLCVC